VTRDEVAAWHRTTVRQVNRWMQKGLLVKLPGYGRKAMFDSRVACRLRPKRKEG
jgi:phage terminase Nu1 subunit (DNA packaging protein)